ncbi:GNAT family N-acetyltransferase [Halobacillus sp. A5]|uniref:GNAT family N-acetyltransferase n=1 Tax=Halobacillus sp. A5 TaxID=2880263 RepID=UPI0020A6BC73|nr:GNAT family protein [Halobacillus sp. A5]MCP3029126.1 GNAT family N-acetyltransferase [Halobacillus sp. A5]
MISLKFFQKQDYDQLINCVESPAFLLQWAGPDFHYPLTYEQLDNYIHEANKQDSTTFIYKAVDLNTNQTVGHIGLKNIDRHNRSVRVGKVLVYKEARGQGVGRRMMEEILSIAFLQLDMHKVTLGVFDFNKPAVQAYKNAGLKIDGLLRDHRRFENEYWSLFEMSILYPEWKSST